MKTIEMSIIESVMWFCFIKEPDKMKSCGTLNVNTLCVQINTLIMNLWECLGRPTCKVLHIGASS